jgi:hypothetical protein
MPKKEIQVTCKSVFKSGENTSKSQFTRKWIEMVNQLEKTKRTVPPKI